MTPQELKNSILQLAIQGKLVEQRAEEGTATELLEKILAAKNAKDAKVGARVPRDRKGRAVASRAPIADDEKPFDIPESWEWYRIGDLFNIVNGFTPLKRNLEFWSNGDIPWFTIEDVRRQGRFIYSTEKFITQKALTKNTERVVPPDTVLLCCTASVGEYAYTKIPLTTNQQFNAFVVKKDYQNYIYPLYVFEYVKTLKNNLIDRAGKTTFNFVSVGKLSKMLIPLPPLAEQERIVAKIEELLPLVDRYEKAWSRLEDFHKRFPVDMQKSLLQMAIQGKLVEQKADEGTGAELLEKILAAKNAEGAKGKGEKSHAKSAKSAKVGSRVSREGIPDDEKPFDIPESWEWARLGELGILKSGYAFKSTEYTKDGVQVVRISDLSDDSIGLKDAAFYPHKPELSQYFVVDGSFLICMTGSIGKMAWVKDGVLRYLNQRVGMFIPNALCSSAYLWFFLHTSYVVDKWIRAKTSTNGNIKNADIVELPIPLPPLAEQKRIVAKLEELLPLCERLKSESNSAANS